MRDIKAYYDEYYKKNTDYFKERNKVKDNPDKQTYYKEYYKMNKLKKKQIKPNIIKVVDSIIVNFN